MTKKPSNPAKRGYLRYQFRHRPSRPFQVIAIGRDWGTRGLNEAIGRNNGRAGHDAINEIRIAVALIGNARISTMDLTSVRGGNGEWSPKLIEIWSRFKKWIEDTDKNHRKDRDATILFAKGYRPTEIEREVKIRNGSAKTRINKGVELYVDVMRGKKKQQKNPRKPHQKREIGDFNASKIIKFTD